MEVVINDKNVCKMLRFWAFIKCKYYTYYN